MERSCHVCRQGSDATRRHKVTRLRSPVLCSYPVVIALNLYSTVSSSLYHSNRFRLHSLEDMFILPPTQLSGKHSATNNPMAPERINAPRTSACSTGSCHDISFMSAQILIGFQKKKKCRRSRPKMTRLRRPPAPLAIVNSTTSTSSILHRRRSPRRRRRKTSSWSCSTWSVSILHVMFSYLQRACPFVGMLQVMLICLQQDLRA